jgi:hypothetical protein
MGKNPWRIVDAMEKKGWLRVRTCSYNVYRLYIPIIYNVILSTMSYNLLKILDSFVFPK